MPPQDPCVTPSIAGLSGNSPLGERQGCRSCPEGQNAPYGQPRLKREAQGTRRVEYQGAIFFRPFLLSDQKKWTCSLP